MSINALSPLKVSDEAFLVASLIDRCPKTMMLRELVVNAIEAAIMAAPAAPIVEIERKIIAGVPKLAIWNNGPGLSPDELDKICDIASSVRKVVSLDGNFGMGAKVASLPSNRSGLIYRSCKDGRVSQVIIGKKEGRYGRLMQTAPGTGGLVPVLDVTALCIKGYDLSTDWTEVVLLGNHVDQDTAANPFDGSPEMPADWIATNLVHRFFRLPPGVNVKLLPGVGGREETTFQTMTERLGEFTRHETVAASDGILVHYYHAEGPVEYGRASPAMRDIRGVAGLVYKNEIYGLRVGLQWAVEAPSFGISFGARTISVMIELPDTADVRTEAYRQFLRFAEGDQRQIMLTDYAEIVRLHMPAWLRRIVNAMAPAQADYIAEVRSELQNLVKDLDLTRMAPAVLPLPAAGPTTAGAAAAEGQPATDAQPATDNPPAEPPEGIQPPAEGQPRRLGPPVRTYEAAPDIIALREQAMIDERGLNGRAARYAESSRQLFVNMLCPAVLRMTLQLQHLFEDFRDQERVRQLSRDIAEWSIIRAVARALIYSMTKSAEGWSADDITRAQSPECLTLVADNFLIGLDVARRRMASLLVPGEAGTDDSILLVGANPGDLQARQRREVELTTMEQAARRGLDLGRAPPGPFMRRLSEVAARRKDPLTALEWAKKAVEADPKDPWSYNNLAAVYMSTSDLDNAEHAAKDAIAAAADAPKPAFLCRMSEIEARRRNHEGSADWARKAIALDPNDSWSHFHLAGALLGAGDVEAAEKEAAEAVSLNAKPPGIFLRRMSEIYARLKDRENALLWGRQAVEADASDAWAQNNLAGLLLQTGDIDGAERASRLAVQSSDSPPSVFLRRLSEIELARRNVPAALDLARRAVAADPDEVWVHYHLSGVLQRTGDLVGADEAAQKALDAATPPQRGLFLRRMSEVRAAQGNVAESLALARAAVEAGPNDEWAHHHLARRLLANRDFGGALASALRAGELTSERPIGMFQRTISEVHNALGDRPEALVWARHAVATDDRDPYNQSHLAALLLATGDLDGAEKAARLALVLNSNTGEEQFADVLRRVQERRASLALELASAPS